MNVESLQEVRQQGIHELRKLSTRLNDGQSQLDCQGVSGLNENEMEALFSNIRPEWRIAQEFI